MAHDLMWRNAEPGDLGAMMRIAEVVHSGFPEGPAVFSERLALYPRGVLLLAGDEPTGYVLSHPWMRDRPPALNTLLGAIPGDPDTYYIHDIALMPRVRGRGHAGVVIDRLMAQAIELRVPTVSLISVIGEPYWRSFGFRHASDRIAAEKLRSYGPAALYMIRDLATG